jgi:hypothetical protein
MAHLVVQTSNSTVSTADHRPPTDVRRLLTAVRPSAVVGQKA